MTIEESLVSVQVPEGQMSVLRYAQGTKEIQPSLILVHDAYGLTEANKALARQLAADGFFVSAPDMFHRAGKMLTSSSSVPYEEQLKIRRGMTNQGHVSDIQALTDFLRRESGPNERIGIVGFCLGGRVTFLAATNHTGVDAAAAFYPTRLTQSDPAIPGSEMPIDNAGELDTPLLAFFPGLDAMNPADNIRAVVDTLARAKHPAETVVLNDADHGFYQPKSPGYHPIRAAEAHARIVEFFRKHLGQGHETT